MAKGATIGGSVSVGGRAGGSSFGSVGKGPKGPSFSGIEGARLAGGRPESGSGGMPKDGASYSFADALRSAGINKTKSGTVNTYNPFTSQEFGSGVQIQIGKGSKPEVGNIGRRDVLQRRVMPQSLRNAPEFNPAKHTRLNTALHPEVSLPLERSIDSLKINASRVVEKQLGQNALDGKASQHAGNTKSQEAALLGQIKEAYDSKRPKAAKYEVNLIKKPATDVPIKSLELKPRPDIKVNSRKPEVSLVKSEDSKPANGDVSTSSLTNIDAIRSALGREPDRQFSVSSNGIVQLEQRVQTAARSVESSGVAPQTSKVTNILDRLKTTTADKVNLAKKVSLIKSSKHLELRDQLHSKTKGKAHEASDSIRALSLLQGRVIQKDIVEKEAEEIVEKVSLKKKVTVKANEAKTNAVSLLKRIISADVATPVREVTPEPLRTAASGLESAALQVEDPTEKAQFLAPVIQLRRQAVVASEIDSPHEQTARQAATLQQSSPVEQPIAQVVDLEQARAASQPAAETEQKAGPKPPTQEEEKPNPEPENDQGKIDAIIDPNAVHARIVVALAAIEESAVNVQDTTETISGYDFADYVNFGDDSVKSGILKYGSKESKDGSLEPTRRNLRGLRIVRNLGVPETVRKVILYTPPVDYGQGEKATKAQEHLVTSGTIFQAA